MTCAVPVLPEMSWSLMRARPPVPPAFSFFHAEDGIRCDLVTGVQTCALPILRRRSKSARSACSYARGRPAVGGLARKELQADRADFERLRMPVCKSSKASSEVAADGALWIEIGRASCREGGWGWGGASDVR